MKTLNDFNIKPQKPWEVEGVEWREVRLKELVEDVKSGFALSKQKRIKINKDIGIPQLRPYNIANWNKIDLSELTFIPKNMNDVEEYFIKYGDVLFNNTNSIELVGRAAVFRNAGGSYTYSNHITRIRVKKQVITPDFLSWYLNFLWNKGFFYMKATKWIGQAGISNKKLLQIRIPIPFRNGKPDLETQKKIVEYIEANFSRIDKILEKKKKELEKLDELWESVLEQAFKPREGEEWREVKLGDKAIAEIIMGQSPPSSSYNKNGRGILFLQGNKEFGELYPKPIMYTTDPKKLCRKNDILISVRAPVGDVNIADGEYCIGRGLAAIRFNGEPKYLFYLLVSIKERIEELGRRGTTFKAITKNHLKNLKIPLPFRNNQPDLEKQKEIANYLDNVYEKIKTTKEKIQRQITLLEEMKESILDEVFKHGETG